MINSHIMISLRLCTLFMFWYYLMSNMTKQIYFFTPNMWCASPSPTYKCCTYMKGDWINIVLLKYIYKHIRVHKNIMKIYIHICKNYPLHTHTKTRHSIIGWQIYLNTDKLIHHVCINYRMYVYIIWLIEKSAGIITVT